MKGKPLDSASEVESHSTTFLTSQVVWGDGGRILLRTQGTGRVCTVMQACDGRWVRSHISFLRNVVLDGGDCPNQEFSRHVRKNFLRILMHRVGQTLSSKLACNSMLSELPEGLQAILVTKERG